MEAREEAPAQAKEERKSALPPKSSSKKEKKRERKANRDRDRKEPVALGYGSRERGKDCAPVPQPLSAALRGGRAQRGAARRGGSRGWNCCSCCRTCYDGTASGHLTS